MNEIIKIIIENINKIKIAVTSHDSRLAKIEEYLVTIGRPDTESIEEMKKLLENEKESEVMAE